MDIKELMIIGRKLREEIVELKEENGLLKVIYIILIGRDYRLKRMYGKEFHQKNQF